MFKHVLKIAFPKANKPLFDISVTKRRVLILLSVLLWAVMRGSHRLLTERAPRAVTCRFERAEFN